MDYICEKLNDAVARKNCLDYFAKEDSSGNFEYFFRVSYQRRFPADDEKAKKILNTSLSSIEGDIKSYLSKFCTQEQKRE